MLRTPRALRRLPIKRLLFLVSIVFHIFEVARILGCQLSPTNDVVTHRLERVYVAGLVWNNGPTLRSHWNDAVIALADALGPENVFITIYESGSWDDSKEALMELDTALAAHNIRRNITLSETTHLDEISVMEKGPGWVDTPRGRRELRRIPYLSRLRNWVLLPLQELARQGEQFDKILFLNDVVFNTDDIFRLLNTNDGDFAAACSLDFNHPPQLYDTFALRDAEGHEPLMQTWPYFQARESREALLRNRPVPVTSCWNGIDNPLRVDKRTYVNPQVRVGYNGEAYDVVRPQGLLLSSWQVFKALWENRVRRWTTSPWLKEWEVSRRVARWTSVSKENKETGQICLTKEMQVLTKNGWAHV
ncbi:hypothetical protein AA0116_g13378 [Alternaria tenuissima]|nr:hypothetical protein AA0116_g13378 [Alternaria tenuissima]